MPCLLIVPLTLELYLINMLTSNDTYNFSSQFVQLAVFAHQLDPANYIMLVLFHGLIMITLILISEFLTSIWLSTNERRNTVAIFSNATLLQISNELCTVIYNLGYFESINIRYNFPTSGIFPFPPLCSISFPQGFTLILANFVSAMNICWAKIAPLSQFMRLLQNY